MKTTKFKGIYTVKITFLLKKLFSWVLNGTENEAFSGAQLFHVAPSAASVCFAIVWAVFETAVGKF